MLLCLICMYGLMLLLVREVFDWLWLIRVSPYAALVIRGGGAPVRFLTTQYLPFGSFIQCSIHIIPHCIKYQYVSS